MPYLLLKDSHNILRWLVILAAVWVLARVWSGLLSGRGWTKQDKISGLVFSSLLNVQFLIGLILYITSPYIQGLRSNMAAAMKDSVSRFYLVEHPFAMFLAVVLAQIGFSAAKRAPEDRSKFLKGVIFYTLATIFIVVAIPWPFLKQGRPLFPGF